MRIGIVTDSTCDLPENLIGQHRIEVVPSVVVIEGLEYADGQDISRSDFYQRLPGLNQPPTTAAPSIGEFTTCYRRLFDVGCEQIISIHATGALTAILATARQAAREFHERLMVVDSRSLSLGLGFQVLAAAESAENGLHAALSAIESTRNRLRLFAALDSVEYVRRSGRVPVILSFLNSLLQIKPLVELVDGEIKAVASVRTTRQANERLASFFKSGDRFERLAILHTGAEARAREFLSNLVNEHRMSLPCEILMVNVTPVIGSHVGPNGLGFAAVRV
jgi:DegV family protein with EDD domain